jgi:hypothetical protein
LGTSLHSPVAHTLHMSTPNPTATPTDAADMANQMPSYPPPGLPHPPTQLPFLYGHPTLGQYHTSSVGMNLPRLYFPAPPYPLGQHGNASAWGYGPPASGAVLGGLPHPGAVPSGLPHPGAVPGGLPHPGGLQPTLPTSNTQALVHTEGVGQLAANPATPPPRRSYPNRVVSDGGTWHSIK